MFGASFPCSTKRCRSALCVSSTVDGVKGDNASTGTASMIDSRMDRVMDSPRSQLLFSAKGQARAYRLIDAFLQPHPHLDGLYGSIEEAIGEAVGWLDSLEPNASQASIGLEVRTNNGDWRTIRQPVQLLCPLPLAA